MCNACQTFKMVIWFGSLIFWTRSVATLHLHALHLSHSRLSIVLIPPVVVHESVYVNSGAYVAPGRYSRLRTRFRLTSSKSVPTRSPEGVMVMCTTEPSMARGFASNVCKSILQAGRIGLLGCVMDSISFPGSLSLTKLAGILPRGRGVETLDASEHLTPPGRYYYSLPAHLGLDAWWAVAGIHR